MFSLSPCFTDGKENYQQTSKLVVDVAADIGMNSKEEDISIAHHLPAKSPRKPIIAKFVRRVTKLDFMKTKRNLAQLETYKKRQTVWRIEQSKSLFYQFDEGIW